MFQFNEKLTRNGYDVWGLADQFHAKPAEIKQLPSRERDVLRLIGQGCPNREIAAQLYLAKGTVKTYVTHLLNRLTLWNRSQLAIYANSISASASLKEPP